MIQRLRFFISLLLIGVFVPLLQAQTPADRYPTRQDPYVNDLAAVLPAPEEKALRTLVQSVSTDFDLTVVTISAIVDYDRTEPSIERFSTTLFNRWGIGDASTNRGVLVVLAMRNRDVRIELGTGYGTQYDDDMKAVIEEYMIPRFREENYAQGLIDGVTQIYREIKGTLPASVGTARPARTPTPRVTSSSGTASTFSGSSSSSEEDGLALAVGGAGVAGVLGAGYTLLRRFQRRRPRPCPACQTRMVRLDEAADDAYLDEGQQREEQLGSVDYDVWECPSCQTRSIFNYKSWFSRYNACPQCNYHTEARNSYVVQRATEYSSGLRRVEADCQHCGHHREWTETIPRIQRSSSSSGGGSRRSGGGGGRSSGGGASGSW